MRKASLLLAALLLIVLSVFSVSAQDGGTIVEVASANDDLSTLVTAILAADTSVMQALSGPGPLTVFAPNNQAFANFDGYLQETYSVTLEDVLAEQELLTSLLLYHVIQGNVFSSQLRTLDGATIPTVSGGFIGIVVNDDGSISLNNGVADVVDADNQASNGVIHVIDQVVFGGTIGEQLEALSAKVAQEALVAQLGNSIAGVIATDPNYSTLFAAVEAAGLTSTLTRGGPFTFFAPTNAAFEAFFAATGLTPDAVLPQTEVLGTVLRYHLVSGRLTTEDLFALDGQEIYSILNAVLVEGEPISVSVPLQVVGGITLNGDVFVLRRETVADNGLVYPIDGILLPPEIAAALGM